LIELLIDVDEVLANKFLNEEKITISDVKAAIRKATIYHQYIPILLGASFKNKGIQPLLDAVCDYLPSPLDKTTEVIGFSATDNEKKIIRKVKEDESFSAVAFKLFSDPFSGVLTFIRIYSGKIEVGETILNVYKDKKEKVQKILRMHANKRTEVQEASAGDIVALIGLKTTITGETLSDIKAPILYDLMKFPESVISIAIEPKSSADESKLNQVLDLLKMEDPTFNFGVNKSTGQLLIFGMGELHLEIILDRLAREHKVVVNSGLPQVFYKETIKKSNLQDHFFNREINGKSYTYNFSLEIDHINEIIKDHSEFELHIENKLLKAPYGDALKKCFHDTVPEFCKGGVLSGYPLTQIKVKLRSFEAENEDFNDVAFKMAISMALRESALKAGIILMEPIMSLEVMTPSNYSGEIIGDLNSRRGKIQNIEVVNLLEKIQVSVPMSELLGYSTVLRSKTQGRATFSMQFDHYACMNQNQMNLILQKLGIYIA